MFFFNIIFVLILNISVQHLEIDCYYNSLSNEAYVKI